MPRGTSAVDYRAHNPKDGGSIPSPATKFWSLFMIAITVTIRHAEEEQRVNLPNDTLQTQRSLFQSCIDRNLILNCYLTNTADPRETSYFAMNLENANEFVQEVNLLELWTNHGFTISTSVYEIDFDTVKERAFKIISDLDDGCWSQELFV